MSAKAKLKRRVRRILIAFFLAAMLVSGSLTVKLFLDYRKADTVYRDIAGVYTLPVSEVPGEKKTAPERKGHREEEDLWEEYAPATVDFETLCGVNPDCRAWLFCRGTPINYPVMQGPDNDTYLHALYDGTYSFAGSIFMDCRAASDLSDARTVLYGHNMLNDSMFGSFDKYPDADYAREHDALYLMTPAQNYRLDVIGALYVADGDELYEPMQDESLLPEFIARVRAESILEPMHENREYSRLCCLSTCAYVFENARLVLVCGMVPIG